MPQQAQPIFKKKFKPGKNSASGHGGIKEMVQQTLVKNKNSVEQNVVHSHSTKKWNKKKHKQLNISVKKSPPADKGQGIKRKLQEEPNAQGIVDNSGNGQDQRKVKKRKLKGQGHDGSLEVKQSVNDSTKLDKLKQEGATGGSPGGLTVTSRNKMNVKADKNWEALLKTLPKETPKKVVHKKNHPKKNWRKPHPKQPKKDEKKPGGSGDSGVKETKSIKREDIWFDDVDELLIEGLENDAEDDGSVTTEPANPLVKDHSYAGTTKAVAMDCEMVGVGEDGVDSVLARVSIVNRFGHVLLDRYVKARERVTDYRTFVSGIRPADLKNAEDFVNVQREVSEILKGRILVGHALHNDLQVLFLNHPQKCLRDTAKYKPFRKLFNGRTPSLKNLCTKLLSVEVQSGEHSSVQDAQGAMRIYTMHRKEWEKSVKQNKPVSKMKKKAKSESKQLPNPLASDSDS